MRTLRAWYGGNYTWLGQGTLVDNAKQVKNARQIYHIRQNTASYSKQLYVSDIN